LRQGERLPALSDRGAWVPLSTG
jgi:hypothetical protein